jgi:Zn finger protein HypA/HybF involved in hydrogenase expression
MKKSIKIPRKRVERDCLTCANMIPIGEGDHICWECKDGECTFVLSDYTPTEDYCFCNGEKWEEL